MIWLALCLIGCEPIIAPTATPTPASDAEATATVDPILGAMRARRIEYTRHGRCRMECRSVSEDEVEEILRVGTVDTSRTRTDGDCPSYAVEGVTSDKQRVRIVYAACSTKTKVVTAIDLDQDWPCGEC